MTDRDGNKKNISRHILPTSSNLLGLCFVIFSLVKVYEFNGKTILDEMVAFTMVLFLASSFLSYASIRSRNKSEKFEKIADTFFLLGLSAMTLISLVIVFQIVRQPRYLKI